MNEMKHIERHALATEETRLWGHNFGREVRVKLEEVLDTIPAGGTIIIELASIEVMDVSFASEVFGKLYASLITLTRGVAVVLADLSEYVEENINAALNSMGLMALTVTQAGAWGLIGKVGEADRETLAVIAQQRQTTAPEVAEALQIKLTTCNQRLRKLAEAAALVRTRVMATTGGEQYVYTWPL